ncbi:MAG TPA: hypothetical protein VGR49_02205 [Actinomycetota bacterium]|jgi:hypothetical protein|nr:hypothetical protein [Actinomycetota bacterium]
MKRIALIVGLTLLGAACARAPGSDSGMKLVPQGGEVRLQRDGVWRTVAETMGLSREDRVEVRGLGRASVELPGGMLELRRGSVLRIGALPELEGGSLLARADSPLSVGVGSVQVRAEEGVYRLDRSFSLRVGVYRGEVSLPGSGWDGTVTAFRQVGVVGGTVPRGPVALQVDPGDPWDDRLLGRALEVGARLERFQQGVALQLPRRGGRDLVAAVLLIDPRTVLGGLPERAPARALSEALVASVVAWAAAPVREVAPEDAFGQVMALRGLGASWMIVAAEWQLAPTALATLVQVTSLLTRGLAPSVGPAGAGAGEGSTSGSTSSAGSSGDAPGGGGTVDEPTEPPLVLPGCTDLISCTVEEVLDVPPDLEDSPIP